MNHTKHWLWPFMLFSSQTVWAEVITDGSLGAAQSIPGPTYAITQALGQTQGSNLFHSFSKFNINTGETADFHADSSITNIYARVTGGSESLINGTISSQSNANLWLMNPSGWLIGKDAALNIHGAFHINSANAIGFKDNALFLADPTGKSTLSVAAPIDYQFTSAKTGTITIDQADLTTPIGQNITLVGGAIKLDNAHVKDTGGNILIGSQSGQGKWQIAQNGLTQIEGQRGTVTLTQTGTPNSTRNPTLGVSGNGKIQIVAQEINLSNAQLNATANNNLIGGDIVLQGETIELTNSSRIIASTTGEETVSNVRGGNIQISGNDLSLNNQSRITTDTAILNSGIGGSIAIYLTGQLSLKNISGINSRVTDNGLGGGIDITTHAAQLNDQSSITVATFGGGDAGSIKLNSNSLNLYDISFIDSSASFGTGNAGNINIQSNNILLVENSTITSGSLRNSGGTAGNIAINAESEANTTNSAITLDHASIRTSTIGITDPDGNLKTGDGGDIKVYSETLVMNGGYIQANSETKGGNGGKVDVQSNRGLFSHDQIFIGGSVPYDINKQPNINVIQAVALNGTNGQVTVSPVGLYISGQLAKVSSNFVSNRPIANDPCSVARGEATSSLVQTGNGGLAPNATDAISTSLQRHFQLTNLSQHSDNANPDQLALYQPAHLCAKVKS